VEVKVLMTWNIRANKDREYFEFLVKRFLPEMQRLGLQPTDAWFTAYGDGPQVLAAALVPSPGAARRRARSAIPRGRPSPANRQR